MSAAEAEFPLPPEGLRPRDEAPRLVSQRELDELAWAWRPSWEHNQLFWYRNEVLSPPPASERGAQPRG